MNAFQLRLMVVYLIHFFAILLVFVGMLFVPLMTKLNDGNLSVLEEQDVARQFLALHSQMWPALGMVLALLILHSVVVSHRIAGPMQRLRDALKTIGEGDLTTRISFRKNDYLADTAADINKLTVLLAVKVTELEKNHRAARAAFAYLRRSLVDGRPDLTERKLEELNTHVMAIEQWLQEFELPSGDAWDDDADRTADDSAQKAEEVGVEA